GLPGVFDLCVESTVGPGVGLSFVCALFLRVYKKAGKDL
ncbi:hypothetical protein TSMEX_001483, partial [Taenia solium]